MECQNIQFAPAKSETRINRALKVIPRGLLMRLLAFALHLLGAPRRAVAALVDMPEESVKTVIRVAMRDGFGSLRDRRRLHREPSPQTSPRTPLRIGVQRVDEWYVVNFGPDTNPLKIPVAFYVQARTVLLSLVNAGLLPVKEAAVALGISASHCRELIRKLADQDVPESLVDKRTGQKSDIRVGPEQKAELIQQLAARIVTGHSTASKVLAEAVNEQTQESVSPRTIRWHINKLGLGNIKETLPQLVEALKKTHRNSC